MNYGREFSLHAYARLIMGRRVNTFSNWGNIDSDGRRGRIDNINFDLGVVKQSQNKLQGSMIFLESDYNGLLHVVNNQTRKRDSS